MDKESLTSFRCCLGCQGKVDVVFQNEVKILIHIIKENRIRHTSGPVQTLNINSVTVTGKALVTPSPSVLLGLFFVIVVIYRA